MREATKNDVALEDGDEGVSQELRWLDGASSVLEVSFLLLHSPTWVSVLDNKTFCSHSENPTKGGRDCICLVAELELPGLF
jgi:hypothetical protein